MLAPMTALSTLLGRSTIVGDELELAITEDWMQGRSAFGGLQAALAVRAMRMYVDAGVPLRTLQMTFVGPAAGTLRARATVLRRGSNATTSRRVSGGDGSIVAVAIGVFGVARRSAAALMPTRPAVEAKNPFEMSYVPGVMPAFVQHFTARWLRGGLLFTGSTDREQVMELGMHDEVATASEAHVISFADFAPPLALSFLKAPANGSTLTWMLEFLGEGAQRFGLAGWRVDAVLEAARDGYTNQGLVVWAPDGTPIAFGRQTMLVFG
jgi:acyl-CoA thioesterase